MANLTRATNPTGSETEDQNPIYSPGVGGLSETEMAERIWGWYQPRRRDLYDVGTDSPLFASPDAGATIEVPEERWIRMNIRTAVAMVLFWGRLDILDHLDRQSDWVVWELCEATFLRLGHRLIRREEALVERLLRLVHLTHLSYFREHRAEGLRLVEWAISTRSPSLGACLVRTDLGGESAMDRVRVLYTEGHLSDAAFVLSHIDRPMIHLVTLLAEGLDYGLPDPDPGFISWLRERMTSRMTTEVMGRRLCSILSPISPPSGLSDLYTPSAPFGLSDRASPQ